MQSEAISEKFETHQFLFLRTSDGFNFKSLEAMISNSSGEYRKPVAKYTNT